MGKGERECRRRSILRTPSSVPHRAGVCLDSLLVVGTRPRPRWVHNPLTPFNPPTSAVARVESALRRRGSQPESGLRGAGEQKGAREVLLEGLLVTNCWDLISSQMIFTDSSEVHLKCSCQSTCAERSTKMVGASAITFSFFYNE